MQGGRGFCTCDRTNYDRRSVGVGRTVAASLARCELAAVLKRRPRPLSVHIAPPIHPCSRNPDRRPLVLHPRLGQPAASKRASAVMVCRSAQPVTLRPAACPCVDGLGSISRHALRRRCKPSSLCVTNGAGGRPQPASWPHAAVMHLDSRHVRQQWRRSPMRHWRVQAQRLASLWANLRNVHATLPLHCLLSGQNATEPGQLVNRTLTRLREEGVHFHTMPPPLVPTWASREHKSSFAKLSVANMSLMLRTRLIALDTDVLLLRSLDHLASRLPPETSAFVTRPDEELINSGVFTLHMASRRSLDLFWGIVHRVLSRRLPPWSPCGGDGGEQAVWIYWLTRAPSPFVELPAGYNAYMWQMNNSADGVNVSGAEAIRRAHPATTVWCKRSALHAVHKTSRLSHKGLSRECFEHISAQERQLRRASSRDRSLSPKCSQEGRRGGTSSGHSACLYT